MFGAVSASAALNVKADKAAYNLGDQVVVNYDFSRDQDFSGLMKLSLSCTSYDLDFYTLPTNLNAGQKQEKAEFHNITAWGKLADICSQFLAKGRRAYVEGRLQTREWQTPDGQRRFATDVVAENMIILDSQQGGGGGSFQANSGAPRYVPSTPAQQNGGEEETTLETIPF